MITQQRANQAPLTKSAVPEVVLRAFNLMYFAPGVTATDVAELIRDLAIEEIFLSDITRPDERRFSMVSINVWAGGEEMQMHDVKAQHARIRAALQRKVQEHAAAQMKPRE